MAPRGHGGAQRGHQSRPKNTFFEFLSCGVHKIERYRSRQDQVKDMFTPYRRLLKSGEKRGDCICDFHSFEHILRERKTLGEEYKSMPKTKVFRFLDLPSELRNHVYEELLVFAQPIEFCPEPFYFRGICFRHKDQSNEHDRAMCYNRKYIADQISAVAPFMRVNKQIHKETSTIFYQQNVFSFSSVGGWIHLDFWLNKINLSKCAMLHQIIVCHPEMAIAPESWRGETDYLDASNMIHAGQANKPGFCYERRWFDNYAMSPDPTLVLNKIGKLEKLGLVIPIQQELLSITTLPINPDAFENLSITLIKLWNDYVVERTSHNAPGMFPAVGTIAADLSTQANDYPIAILNARVHAQGRYATGFVKDFEEELAEIEAEEATILDELDFMVACKIELPFQNIDELESLESDIDCSVRE